ncbi:MAG: hypothetical protein P8Y42_21645 [Exilibacterium sp.]
MKQILKSRETQWDTELGGYFPGERAVLHGKDLFSELKDLEWMEFLIFGVCGRMPDKKQARLLSNVWTLCASYPDPRLWNNRVGALAGVARSTGSLGISAGIAVSESTVYGHATLISSSKLLLELKQRVDGGENLAKILKDKILERPMNARPSSGKMRKPSVLSGFGRPVSKREERIAPLMAAASELGFANGPMVTLAFEVEATLLELGLRTAYLNAGGLISALFCDQGFSLREQYYLSVLQHSACVTFCAADAAKHREGSFFPLCCEQIKYNGKPPRKWR